jgi:hypothetical protein
VRPKRKGRRGEVRGLLAVTHALSRRPTRVPNGAVVHIGVLVGSACHLHYAAAHATFLRLSLVLFPPFDPHRGGFIDR